MVFAAGCPPDKCGVYIGKASIRNRERNNNAQERFNWTFRASEVEARHQERRSRFIIWFFVRYNFVRPHMAIG